jgi:predicted Zn-dependent protease
MRLLRLSSALLMLVCVALACAKAPVTGRSQFMLVSEAEEMQLGADGYAEILETSDLSTDEEAVGRLRTIGRRIAEVTGEEDYEWEFNLIENDSIVNAFCLPGGKVAFYTGILELAETDDEIATVMAHEIAHATARHGGERMTQLLMYQLGGIALSEALKNNREETIALAQVAYGVGATLAYVLPYSRTHESEADHIGLIYMAKAGYDPRAAVTFWKKMQEHHAGQEPLEWLSTHPSSQTRIENLERIMPDALKYYDEGDGG